MNRREFLRHSSKTAAAAAVVAANVGRAQQPNERIGVGVIGIGGMGSGHLNTLKRLKEDGVPVDIVAVCDIYTARLNSAAQSTGAKPYADYRKLLEDKDVDAVCIATPDHWHARITIDAADAGKDVYCEKPMTHWRNLKEPQEVVRAIARNKRVMQVGTQMMSDPVWGKVAERVKAGAVGKLIHAQASDMRNQYYRCYDPTAQDPNVKPGETIDWNMFLGSAPRVPFDVGRYLAFRCFWDYSGGMTTDFFPHILTPLVKAMNLTFPRRAVSSGGLYQQSDKKWEVPDIVSVCIEYPDGPSILLLASLSNDANLPMLIRGYKATVEFGGKAVIRPQRATNPDGQEEQIDRTGGGHYEHWTDFLTCIKTRNKPQSHEVLGYYVMTALHMGVHSYLTGRAWEFDPKTETAKPVA